MATIYNTYWPPVSESKRYFKSNYKQLLQSFQVVSHRKFVNKDKCKGCPTKGNWHIYNEGSRNHYFLKIVNSIVCLCNFWNVYHFFLCSLPLFCLDNRFELPMKHQILSVVYPLTKLHGNILVLHRGFLCILPLPLLSFQFKASPKEKFSFWNRCDHS